MGPTNSDDGHVPVASPRLSRLDVTALAEAYIEAIRLLDEEQEATEEREDCAPADDPDVQNPSE